MSDNVSSERAAAICVALVASVVGVAVYSADQAVGHMQDGVALPADACSAAVVDRIEIELKRLKTRESARNAMNQLRLLPAECVVPKLIDDVLADEGVGPVSRAFAYELLFALHAEDSERGVEALLRGLNDSVGRLNSVKALARVRGDRVYEVAAAIAAVAESDAVDVHVRDYAYEALAQLGYSLETVAQRALVVLGDAAASDQSRWASAVVLVRLYSREGRLAELLSAPSDQGRSVALIGAVAQGMREYAAEMAPGSLDAVVEFIAEALHEEAAVVRLTALRALPVVVAAMPSAKRLDQSLQGLMSVVRHEMEIDPDPGVRSVASDVHRVLEGIISAEGSRR